MTAAVLWQHLDAAVYVARHSAAGESVQSVGYRPRHLSRPRPSLVARLFGGVR